MASDTVFSTLPPACPGCGIHGDHIAKRDDAQSTAYIGNEKHNPLCKAVQKQQYNILMKTAATRKDRGEYDAARCLVLQALAFWHLDIDQSPPSEVRRVLDHQVIVENGKIRDKTTIPHEALDAMQRVDTLCSRDLWPIVHYSTGLWNPPPDYSQDERQQLEQAIRARETRWREDRKRTTT